MVVAAPDLVFTNGRVLTMDERFWVAEAVAVRRGRIVAVGGTGEVAALAGPGTRTVDLGGRTLLPGINDSHLHGAAYGLARPPFALDLGYPTVRSIGDIVAAVREAASRTAPGEWIVGVGWDPGYLDECRSGARLLPDRHDLDAVAPHHPVCLGEFSAHLLLANSEALRRAGITRGGAVPGGLIDVDAPGEPTGILREGAQRLVQSQVPVPTVAQRRAAIRGVVADLHARGITSYTEPGLGFSGSDTLFGGLGIENWTAYAELATESTLDCRVTVLLLPAPMGGSASQAEQGLADLAGLASPDPRRLQITGVKIFADGVPPNRTAWMSEPYVDGGHGSLCVSGATAELRVDEVREMIRLGHAAGYQVGVHVTGDRAIDTVVDALLAANRAHPRPDARHYVIHGDFASPRSLARLAAHGYGINMNPAIKWTVSDLMDGVVGERRSAYQWPVRDAFRAGLAVCASSDAPITEPDWRRGVAGMMLRESKASGRPSGPEQCVGLREALRAYTANPAWQDFAESWKGTVEVGKVADLCVLDRDLTATDPHDLVEVRVAMTVFDGRVVYES
ncbi:MAG TPA: amidohydrolase [Rugosimonospora sp.]|nr:amidohydrolase [Rugosimonospora sp.]